MKILYKERKLELEEIKLQIKELQLRKKKITNYIRICDYRANLKKKIKKV